MLTLRDAAALLAADGPDVLARIAALCGCPGQPAALDRPAREALGLAAFAAAAPSVAARVARGPGALRALLLEVNGAASPVSLRDVVPRLATRMARCTPHLAWLCVAAVRGADRQLVLASWSVDRHPPRTAALVVDRDAVVDSDAETLCALSGPPGPDDTLTHARWLEVLGREALGRRFYRGLERIVARMAADVAVPAAARRPAPDDRRALAVLYASRLMFLAFLEAKGWLAGDRAFLTRTFAEGVRDVGQYHARVLRPLFFGTLNTPVDRRARAARSFGAIPFLNGGLFAPTGLERRYRSATFSDEVLGALFGEVISRYRFTAREDRRSWSEAAIDPEMLGRAFESLMEPRERHATGAYYTPQALVERVTHEALTHALASPDVPVSGIAGLLAGETLAEASRAPVHDRLVRMRVLDPACGSGAFLVYALEVLATVAERVGDTRSVSERRRAVLTRSIFGVDVNPMAVWLCELRLWLSVVIDAGSGDPSRVAPLPNLDRNVRVGDVLAGGAFAVAGARAPHDIAWSRAGRRMTGLRERYARATGTRKRIAARVLEHAERTRSVGAMQRELAHLAGERRDAVCLARGRDLFGGPAAARAAGPTRRSELRLRGRALRARLRALMGGAALPFSFSVQFADVEAAGGFDAVVGNPPWVRPHAIPAADRERLRRDFAVYRDAAWASGSVAARAGAGFGGQVDLAALFVERAIGVAREGGIVALLLPSKLWRSLAGGSVRRLVAERTQVLTVEDWSAARATFDAAAYPSLLVLRRGAAEQRVVGRLAPSVAVHGD